MLPENMRAKIPPPRADRTVVYVELDYRELKDCMVIAMREAMTLERIQERKRRERAVVFYGIAMLFIAFIGIITWNPFLRTSIPILAGAFGVTHAVALWWVFTRWL